MNNALEFVDVHILYDMQILYETEKQEHLQLFMAKKGQTHMEFYILCAECNQVFPFQFTMSVFWVLALKKNIK